MGRSQYSLQEYAGSFGSFLDPVFAGTGKDIAAMSEQFAELAVDLASFYNTSDEEARMRLFSGLSGETEAVRRLGINIADARLAELNKELHGQQAIYKYLSLREKTELRMIAIMRDTVTKQGDAARTADSWANSLKRVQDKFRDFSVRLGKRIMPTAKKLLLLLEGGMESVAKAVDYVTRQTHTLEVVLAMVVAKLGYATAAAASFMFQMKYLPMVVAYMGELALAMGRFAKHAAVFLIFEDFIGFLQGHQSVIGGVISELYGVQDPIDALSGSFEELEMRIANMVTRLQNLPEAIKAAVTGGDAMTVLNTGTVDVDQKQRDAQQSKERQFQAAVERGDPNAATGFRRSGEDPREANDRFKRQRKTYVQQNPMKATPTDVKYGFAAQAFAPDGPVEQSKAPPLPVNGSPMLTPQERAQATAPFTSGKGPTRPAVYKVDVKIDARGATAKDIPAIKEAGLQAGQKAAREIQAATGDGSD